MARSRGFRHEGRKIDFKSWAAMPSIRLALTADSTNLGGSLQFAIPATILRMRGRLRAHLEATIAAGDFAKLAVGLAVISTDAFNAGAGSVPDPVDEPEFPWVYWTEFELSSESANVDEAWGYQSVDIIVDSKAMRKVKPGEALAWIAQYADGNGTPPMSVDISQTRVLVGT